jgi:Spy/CpxP family protein refolding chaperone
MPKSKFSAFLSLLLVFLSGAVVGALGHRLYMVKTVYTTSPPPPRHPDPEEVRRRITADLKAKVHLDDQQVAALNRMMDETNDAWHKMRDQMNTQGRALHEQQWQKFRDTLRADQQPLYDQWRAERDAEIRKRHEQEHKGPGGPPRP